MTIRLLATSFAVASAVQTYRAAVVEFAPELAAAGADFEAVVVHKLSNLKGMEAFAREAKDNGTQIIIFPEYGITGDCIGNNDGSYFEDMSRKTVGPYLEDDAPLVGAEPNVTLPCGDAATTASAPAIAKVSCMAKELEMVIVINLLTKQDCQASVGGCPTDGMRVYNTAVAFAEDGHILSLYHKRNPYGDEKEYLDKGEDSYKGGVTFTTSFGVKFGMFICYDIMFFTDGGPDALEILYPTDWTNTALGPIPDPLKARTAQKAWSLLHGKNLLASNYGGWGKDDSGSGIWNKGSALESFFNPTKDPQSKLLIADVPILNAAALTV